MISIRLIRKTAICTVIIGAVYMIACTYLWARQGYFIFTPRREIKKTPASVQLPYENIYISLTNALGRTERIHSWWIPNSNASGRVLLYLHGSALNIGANVNAIRRFHNLGFAVFIVSY